MAGHFLFIAVGSAGDVLPLIAIAQAMRQRGHRATLVANYGYAETAAATGIGYIPLSTQSEHEEVVRDKRIFSTRYQAPFHSRHSVRWNRVILETIEACASPDLVIVASERPNLWADLVARRHLSVRSVRTVIDLPILPAFINPGLPAGRVLRVLDAHWGADWAEYLETRGIRAGSNHVPRIWKSVRPLVSTIALWPDWVVDRSERRGLRGLFGFMPLPSAAIKDAERLPAPKHSPTNGRERGGHLVFVAGTEGTTGDWLRQFIDVSGEVCRKLGRPGVLLGGTAAPEESPPGGGLSSIAFAPLNEVLADAVAIIHHGGIGTAASALESGVPQVIIPRLFMQPMNAEWLRRLGVCSVVHPREWTTPNAVRCLGRVVGDCTMRSRAAQIAQRIDRTAALNEVCRFLEVPANYS
jgi:UDP:flavonoid glycosyltransferase YjiC (YdhE family)